MDCQANPDCDCVVQCVGEMGVENLAACQKECEVDALPPEAIPLQTCQAQNCAAECG
jgi:hypothetical protein